MKAKQVFHGIFIALVISSCRPTPEEAEKREVMMAKAEVASMVSTVRFAPPALVDESGGEENAFTKRDIDAHKANRKKIIKDGDISINSADVFKSKTHIDEVIKKHYAYYETEELSNVSTSVSYTLKIRIPSDHFEKVLDDIESGEDEITRKIIQARDVTEEYIDIETRLANKKAYLKKYNELLAKAGTVTNMLAIQENIRLIQEEIESKEGRLKYLSDQVDFSTLKIYLIKIKESTERPQEHPGFFKKVKIALHDGWLSVVDFVLCLINRWPEMIVAGVAIYILRRIYQKRKKTQLQ